MRPALARLLATRKPSLPSTKTTTPPLLVTTPHRLPPIDLQQPPSPAPHSAAPPTLHAPPSILIRTTATATAAQQTRTINTTRRALSSSRSGTPDAARKSVEDTATGEDEGQRDRGLSQGAVLLDSERGRGLVHTQTQTQTQPPQIPADDETCVVPATAAHNISEEDAVTMADDDAYAAFLDKADADRSAAPTTQEKAAEGKGKRGFTESSVDVEEEEVPRVLREVDVEFVSESEERFEVVCFRVPADAGAEVEGKGKGVGVDLLAHLTTHPPSTITPLSPQSFDPRNEYKPVLDAVRQASDGGEIEVFRVELGGARCEYWVVGLEGGRVVGLRVGAVES